MKIGIVAPSSVIPKVELKLGIEEIKKRGFDVCVHPQVYKRYFSYAGDAQERALGFLDYATDPSIDALWFARGGYGAGELLPILSSWAKKKGKPQPKLLLGFSDATALMVYVNQKWKWSTLHAPMPGTKRFTLCTHKESDALFSYLRKGPLPESGTEWSLKYLYRPSRFNLSRVEILGGNLTVWSSLMGTPDQPRVRGKVLFFEEISESPNRIARMIHQIAQAGGFDGVKGIILGDFMDCKDQAPMVLKSMPALKNRKKVLSHPKSRDLKLLRPILSTDRWLLEIFGKMGKSFHIPILKGFPAGHGKSLSSLPLGASYSIHSQGKLKLLEWSWLKC